jgi:purine-nucleoside/S-methyl-5'-thioadenosine phosphorylase / adenosine deaminase
VFLLQPDVPAVGVVHAGWRGTAAGVLEQGLERMTRETNTGAADLFVHLGPAICGRCYEVGPDVLEALGLPGAGGPSKVDLRAVLEARARTAGVAPERITRSSFCTRCGASPFLSHRGGDRGRQLGIIGIQSGAQRESHP